MKCGDLIADIYEPPNTGHVCNRQREIMAMRKRIFPQIKEAQNNLDGIYIELRNSDFVKLSEKFAALSWEVRELERVYHLGEV